MNKVRMHAAANTKTRVLMSKMIKDGDFKRLSTINNLNEFLHILSVYPDYRELLKDKHDFESIEAVIRKNVLLHFEKLYHFYIDTYRKFFKILFLRYEIENIKLYLRAISRSENIGDIESHIIYSKLLTNVNYQQLSRAKNLKQLVESLTETLYFDILEQYLYEDSSKILFYMEMALDRRYFNLLHQAILQLKGVDRKLVLELFGINVDLLNIQWIYRGRKYFKITPEELFNYTLNGGLKYDFKHLKDLCYLSLSEFEADIRAGDYQAIFADKVYLLERATQRYIYNQLDVFLQKGKLSIIVPVAYMFKMEYEMRDLCTLLQGIKQRFKNIDQFLVRNLERGM